MTFEIDPHERAALVEVLGWALEHLQRQGRLKHRPFFLRLVALSSRLGMRFSCACGETGIKPEDAIRKHQGARQEPELAPITNPKVVIQ